ncbi:MBG domain-containing protein [Mucilaginibacter boryungensis]|uniref:Gliding motility-associated C-terminal domain-containing protein n=1 Tax=Mucilaginibacter boryungensis TaxID=768480 RepID=A0ABR9XII2_9SPHI|nr:MBG domain-containing protein [Mucilaginibacter boryungensis]MBE9666823.1 gliding motility-associated C-terminal domain-containing protein [Mucilaginibacter boryungensis]
MTKRLFYLIIILIGFVISFNKSEACVVKGIIYKDANFKSSYATPVINESGTPGYLSTTYGTASTAANFTVSGTNMTAGILVTPPMGYEVSVNNSTFYSTLTIGSAGNIPNTIIYIRLMATASSGNYGGNIVLSSSGAANVNVATTNSTINKAPLTVTANNANKMYGTTLTGGAGSQAFTVTGLQNGETIGSVTIAYGTGAQATDPVGTYTSCVAIGSATGGTFSANNYNITYVGANIIVNPAPLVVIADDVSKVYGTTITGGPGSKAFTTAGLQNGETVGTVTIGYGTGAAAADVAGAYIDCVTIAAATGGSFTSHNYIITYVPGKLTVVPAALSIYADDVTKVYGTVLQGGPGYTAFTSSGLQNGETIGSVLVGYGTAGAADAHVGNCRSCVTVANATGGTFNPFNYKITYEPGNILVTPAPLTIIADDKIKQYGEPNPVLTASYSGLVNGDSPAQLTIKPIITTPATDISPPGSYPITATGALSPDYTITYVPGTLLIVEAYAIPNAFTPNGDGINDTWHIQFLDSYHHCTVSVYNRFGQSVFYANDYGTPWDGTFQGGALPAGVYYYVIDLKNINKHLAGYITIIR